MSEASKTWQQLTFGEDPALTSLLESAGGNSPCNSPDGPPTDPVGPEAAPVNPTRRRASKKATPTTATCGPTSSASSASAALTQSLASRLRERLSTVGSTECTQTWREKVTPSGLAYWAHTASGRRTSDSGSTGWQTPSVADGMGGHLTRGGARSNELLLPGEAKSVMGWPTPMAQNPAAGNCDFTRAVEAAMGLRETKNSPLLVGWNTPRATDGSHGGPNQTGETLTQDAHRLLMASPWATPSATDHKGSTKPGQRRGQLSEQTEASGAILASSPVETGKPVAYRLNPFFSLWLMGFPVAWGCSGVLAMQSCRKSPRRSSKRSSKRKAD